MSGDTAGHDPWGGNTGIQLVGHRLDDYSRSPGEMNIVLEGVLILTGLGAILWSSERYRSHSNKRDLVVGTTAGTGLILLGVAPSFYDAVGAVLSLQSRFVTASLLGNLFLLMVFYLSTVLRKTQRDVTDLSRSISVVDAASDARPDGGAQPILQHGFGDLFG